MYKTCKLAPVSEATEKPRLERHLKSSGDQLSRFSVTRLDARAVICALGEFVYIGGTLAFESTTLGEEIVNYFLKKRLMVREWFNSKGTTRLPFAGLSLLTLLVGAFAVSCGGTAAKQGAEEQASVELEHPALGNENAPVVLTEYADYQ